MNSRVISEKFNYRNSKGLLIITNARLGCSVDSSTRATSHSPPYKFDCLNWTTTNYAKIGQRCVWSCMYWFLKLINPMLPLLIRALKIEGFVDYLLQFLNGCSTWHFNHVPLAILFFDYNLIFLRHSVLLLQILLIIIIKMQALIYLNNF